MEWRVDQRASTGFWGANWEGTDSEAEGSRVAFLDHLLRMEVDPDLEVEEEEEGEDIVTNPFTCSFFVDVRIGW